MRINSNFVSITFNLVWISIVAPISVSKLSKSLFSWRWEKRSKFIIYGLSQRRCTCLCTAFILIFSKHWIEIIGMWHRDVIIQKCKLMRKEISFHNYLFWVNCDWHQNNNNKQVVPTEKCCFYQRRAVLLRSIVAKWDSTFHITAKCLIDARHSRYSFNWPSFFYCVNKVSLGVFCVFFSLFVGRKFCRLRQKENFCWMEKKKEKTIDPWN